MYPTELKQLLEKNGVDFELIFHEKAIKSRNDALCYFNLEEMAPTLILKSEKGLLALIISGSREKIDFVKIQSALELTSLQMAKKEEVSTLTNLKPGKVPLIGHKLPCIIDNHLLDNKYVYGGSGDFNYTLKIAPKDLRKMNDVILEIF